MSLKRRSVNIFFLMFFLNRVNLFAVGSGGIANEVTSAEGLSNLLQVTGSKTDPATVYNNPASIGDLGKYNTSLGLTYYRFSAEHAGNGTTDKMNTGNIVVPNFGFGSNVADGKLGFGLAVVSPYGLSTEWADDSSVRYNATKSTVKMYDITPAVSYRPSEKLSFGIGADYFNTFNADLENKVQTGGPDGNAKLSGSGDQWGYHLGFLFNPSKSHTLGLTYHSEVKTRIEGDLELTDLSGAAAFVAGGTSFKTHAFTDLFYPQNFQFGYKYSKEEKWELGFNAAWYDWSSNQQLAVNLPNATALQQSVFGAPIPLKWRDVWSFTIGGMYRFSETWKLNAGAYYLPAVYPSETFSARVPDMDKIGLSVGPSWTKGHWGVDGVYNPLFYKKTSISNSVNPGVNGDYKAMVHIVGVNLKYKY